MTKLFTKGIILLIGGLLLFYANAFFGNPVSKRIANQAAETYMNQQDSTIMLEKESTRYNMKTGAYDVELQSKNSIDTHFTLSISPIGKVVSNNYEEYVSSKLNTWDRVNNEYREIVDTVFLADDFPYAPIISYGALERSDNEGTDFLRKLYPLTLEDLEVDEVYDVKELAKSTGHIVLHIVYPQLNTEQASDLLLEIKKTFDRKGIPFYTLSLLIKESGSSENMPDIKTFEVQEFLYSDIYEKNLSERINKSVQETGALIQE